MPNCHIVAFQIWVNFGILRFGGVHFFKSEPNPDWFYDFASIQNSSTMVIQLNPVVLSQTIKALSLTFVFQCKACFKDTRTLKCVCTRLTFTLSSKSTFHRHSIHYTSIDNQRYFNFMWEQPFFVCLFFVSTNTDLISLNPRNVLASDFARDPINTSQYVWNDVVLRKQDMSWMSFHDARNLEVAGNSWNASYCVPALHCLHWRIWEPVSGLNHLMVYGVLSRLNAAHRGPSAHKGEI